MSGTLARGTVQYIDQTGAPVPAPETTNVPLSTRRLWSVAERMGRAFLIAFVPVLLLQLTTNKVNLSTLQLAAVAALGPALSALMSTLGIILPGTNPATPSLLPGKLDPTTPNELAAWVVTPTSNVRVLEGDGRGEALPAIDPGPRRAAAQAGHDLIPPGSSWEGPAVVEVTDATPWPARDGSYDYLPTADTFDPITNIGQGVAYATGGNPPPGTTAAGEPENIAVTQPTEAHRLEHPSIGSYGFIPQPPDPHDWHLAGDSLPVRYSGAFVDLSSGFPDDPYDQGQLGSCVSNGTAAVVDFARAKQGLTPLHPPSRLFIYYHGRQLEGTVGEDSGLYVRDGIKVVATVGAPPETDYPYDISRFTDAPTAQAEADAKLDEAVKYLKVGVSQIDDTIASGYPVVFGFTVPTDFEGVAIASDGIMPLSSWLGKLMNAGHCVVAVSTPKMVTDAAGNTYEARKCRNSWGKGWGASGYFWMPTQFMGGSHCSDFWMVASLNDPQPQPTPQPTPQPSGDAFLAALGAYSGAIDELTAAASVHNRRRHDNQTPEQYGAWLVAGALGVR